jgi:hypothetical protein
VRKKDKREREREREEREREKRERGTKCWKRRESLQEKEIMESAREGE